MKIKNLLLAGLIASVSFSAGLVAASTIFGDVDYTSWYADSVNRLNQLEVIEGYDDGDYKPDQYVNRAELATILTRLMDKVGGDLASDAVCMHDGQVYFDGEGYYDGCNWQTCNEGGFGGTEIGCEVYGEEQNSWEAVDIDW